MQEANVRVGALDGLAVHLQHHAHHAVRCRMLRAEIHRKIADMRGTLEPGIEVFESAQWDLVAHGAFEPFSASSVLAFSSPGRMRSIPSQGDRKSKVRNSCFSLTGS